jgi:tetratricopeptide (TPR) repeat protein
MPDSLEAVEVLLTQAQSEFRAGNRESAAQILVRAAQAYEALNRPDNAVSIYRSLCKGPHGTTAVVELWFANCERRDDRREGAAVACDLGDRAIQDNDLDRARSWFERALKLDPNNVVASRRLERLAKPSAEAEASVAEPAAATHAPAELESAPPEPASAVEPEPEAEPEPEPVPAASEAPVPAAAPPSEDGHGEEGRVAIAVDRGQAVTFDFSSMLAEFQRGVETQISGDTQAHYDLAVAYREMGLVDQAIEAFRLAAQDVSFKQRCAEMIGHCLLEVGQFEEAVRELSEALTDPQLGPESAVGIRFELGLALEAGGRVQEALAEFEQVFEVDANYPEVGQKIRSLRKSLEAA